MSHLLQAKLCTLWQKQPLYSCFSKQSQFLTLCIYPSTSVNFVFFYSSNKVGTDLSTTNSPLMPCLSLCSALGQPPFGLFCQKPNLLTFLGNIYLGKVLLCPHTGSKVNTDHKCSNCKPLNSVLHIKNDKGYYTSSLFKNSHTKQLCI